MDLFLKVDEYLSKPLEDLKASYFSGGRGDLRTQILVHPPDKRFNKSEIFDEFKLWYTHTCIFYDNWLKIFKDSPGFFVEHHKSLDFKKIVDNIEKKNKAIIKSFQTDIWMMLIRNMEREKLAQVERDILVGWLTEFLQLLSR